MKNEMKKPNQKGGRLRSLIPTKRRLIQLYAALLFNANLKGFANGYIYRGPLKNICTPGLNCYSCPGASGACPLGSLQNALAGSNKRAPYYLFGIILLYGILLGRWICGFLCPFGLIQDLLHKIKTPKLKKNRFTRVLSYLKYVILVLFVFYIPLVYVWNKNPAILPAFCKYICPAGTLEGAMGLLSNKGNSELLSMLGPLFTWKFVLMVGILVAAVFIYRFFCRFLCPLGALYGLFNKIAICGIKLEKPNVLCHMLQSIDGKVTGSFLSDAALAPASEVYYALNRELRGEAFACGRVTMEESFTKGFFPDMTLFEDKQFPTEDYIADPEATYFAVAFDTHGRLGWKSACIADEDPGYDGAHVIEVLCENVDPRYLTYMRRVGVSYIFAGTEELDLPLALHKLKTLFGIERLLLEGGSVLNGSFLRAGFVDAISLVTAPVIAPAEGKTLFDGAESTCFTLAETKTYENGVLWTYYARLTEE